MLKCKQNHVAVYGTLRPGEGNNILLEDSIYLGKGKVEGYDMYSNGAFPYAVPGVGTLVVDIYQISEKVLTNLDRLEGFPHHYDRTIVEINGYSAWIYFRADTPRGLRRVESGDWMLRRA